jgi:uncharacterized RDD family membrane protein YckC
VTMDPSAPRDPNAPSQMPEDESAPGMAPPPPTTPPPSMTPPGPPPPPMTPPPGQSWQSQPPPQQGWQGQPQGWQGQQPPPGGATGGMPSWTSNLTAQGTIQGPAGLALADVPNRVIASVIDFVILGIVGFIVGAIIHPILGDRFTFFGSVIGTVPSLFSSIVVAAIMAAVSAGYFIYTWLRMGGATVGMRLLKLNVRDAQTGGPITQQQAINRWLVFGAPYALSFLYGWGIGILISIGVLVWYVYLLITTAQSPTRQGFHDKYSGTVVAKLPG